MQLENFERKLHILSIAQAAQASSQFAVFPVLALLATQRGIDIASAGLIAAIPNLVSILTRIPIGLALDKTSKGKILLAGTLLTIPAPILYASSQTWFQMVLSGGLFGLALSLFQASAWAMLLVMTPPHRRGYGLGLLGAAFYLGQSIGPIASGYVLGSQGLEAVFLYASILAIGALPALVFLIPSAGGDKENSVRIGNTRNSFILNEKNFLAAAIIPVSTTTALGALIVFFPLYAKDVIGMAPSDTGIVIGASALAQVAVRGVLGGLSDRLGRRIVAIAGLSTVSMSLILLSISHTMIFAAVSTIILGIGIGFTIPAAAALYADSISPSRAGLGMGIFQTTFNIGFVIGSASMGFVVAGFGFPSMLITNAAVQVTSTAVFIILVGIRTRSKAPGEL